MNINFKELKEQLYPGWTPVNIGIMVAGFLIWWPVGLFMVAYVLTGERWGLDLRDTSTIPIAANNGFNKLKVLLGSGAAAVGKATESKANGGNQPSWKTTSSGTPDAHTNNSAANQKAEFEQWRAEETRKLDVQRNDLQKERSEFELQKKKQSETSQG